jgi:hypothetical protein
MTAPTILDLVANKTLSARVAAALWAAIDARLSFVVTAVPRFAGKSTLMNAVLGLLRPDVPVHRLDGSPEETQWLEKEASDGYLVAAEISQAPEPGYIWGEPVRTLFATLASGYSLATALHAPGLDETFEVLCRQNGLGDEAASRVKLVLHLRRFGDDHDSLWRRLAEVHEVDSVTNGRPKARLLFRWRETDDTFESVEPPRRLGIDEVALDLRAQAISSLVRSSRTGAEDLADLMARLSPKP